MEKIVAVSLLWRGGGKRIRLQNKLQVTEGTRIVYGFVGEENVNKVLVDVLTDDRLGYEYIGDDLRETYPIKLGNNWYKVFFGKT
ncbi:hypothetical protein ATZ36_04195 [Candidatus Endomicrobiellum trichonymphae]|uniref:Uncharacterized protein n=1 Tax=Endomicrobium trichonymphae TaxID=1408204 RepID=A0A1E5IJB3_ENDTX|nr:hypothetical protein ATZ36_04195 [Candidatus Endomicrobium trichonymphae]